MLLGSVAVPALKKAQHGAADALSAPRGDEVGGDAVEVGPVVLGLPPGVSESDDVSFDLGKDHVAAVVAVWVGTVVPGDAF